MRRTLMALAASSALVVTSVAMPTKAEAHVWWVIPVVAGGALLTGAVANAAYANPYYGNPYYAPNPHYGAGYNYVPAPAPTRAYYGGGRVSVQPTCQIMRQRTADGWRRIRVCG